MRATPTKVSNVRWGWAERPWIGISMEDKREDEHEHSAYLLQSQAFCIKIKVLNHEKDDSKYDQGHTK